MTHWVESACEYISIIKWKRSRLAKVVGSLEKISLVDGDPEDPTVKGEEIRDSYENVIFIIVGGLLLKKDESSSSRNGQNDSKSNSSRGPPSSNAEMPTLDATADLNTWANPLDGKAPNDDLQVLTIKEGVTNIKNKTKMSDRVWFSYTTTLHWMSISQKVPTVPNSSFDLGALMFRREGPFKPLREQKQEAISHWL
ncbi:hypothetical protein RUM44_009206 [Polyplax serrata]|uniref:Uncharacterized protein n=1 Tax=Polyplax serrata TaxID=468196 RepID=A0ABR1AS14_POLSC